MPLTMERASGLISGAANDQQTWFLPIISVYSQYSFRLSNENTGRGE
jgi:hypothetical protein